MTEYATSTSGDDSVLAMHKIEVRNRRGMIKHPEKEDIIPMFGGLRNITEGIDEIYDMDIINSLSRIRRESESERYKIKVEWDIIPPKMGYRIIYNMYERWGDGPTTSSLDKQGEFLEGWFEDKYSDMDVVYKGTKVYCGKPIFDVDDMTIDVIEGK